MNTKWKLAPCIAALVVAACNTKSGENRDDTPSSIAPQPGPQPKFLTPMTRESPPPPISGGTLTMGKDGRTVIAADSDRDRIYVVDIPSRTVKYSIPVAKGAEPGRVAVDTKGHAYVALRSSGGVVDIDLATGTSSEKHVCVAPRGLAYDAKLDAVHVACAEGVLTTMFLDGRPARRVSLDRDLRDVVVTKNTVLVSRFRSADVIKINSAGEVAGKTATRGGNLGWRIAMPEPSARGSETAPTTPDAPDAVDGSDDEPAIISQDPTNPTGTVAVGYYGSGNPTDACLSSTITMTRLDIPGHESIFIPPAVLPVDLATNGKEYAIVAAGNGHTSELPQIFVHHLNAASRTADSTSGSLGSSGSSSGFTGGGRFGNVECTQMAKGFLPGQAIAAAYDGNDDLIVQSRQPAALFIMSPDRQRVWKEIALSDESAEDTGHAIFHSNSGGFLACASCHAEGAEDGRTWTFVEGERRTPSMRGTIANTAPFHWDGAMKDLNQLVDHVFVTRMSGPKVNAAEVDTLKQWLFRLPPPPKVAQNVEMVARGEELFRQRGCTSCHAGAELTNNETRDVGTGGSFQVPSLIGVGWRGPFLHNGCAKTLKDRFDGSCGGSKHGDISGLDRNQVEDLATYLESL
jgi:hypothetical protein